MTESVPVSNHFHFSLFSKMKIQHCYVMFLFTVEKRTDTHGQNQKKNVPFI